MPLQQNSWGNLDITAQLFRGMASQEQAVEECGFSLGEVEVMPRFILRCGGRHNGRVVFSLHKRSKTKGNFTGSFNGVKWLGREITWFYEV
jgi:hypothetical protein